MSKENAHLLLIEDDEFKAKRINTLLREHTTYELTIAHSVTSGLETVFSLVPSAILLDMSLSTFDVGPRETGGRPQNFGGQTVLSHLLRRNVAIPTIVITQFETFPRDGKDVGLDEIRRELSERFRGTFRGLIYYNSRETAWEAQLLSLLDSLVARED